MSWQDPLFSTIFAINFFKEFSTKEISAMNLVLGTVLASLDKFSTTELICQTVHYFMLGKSIVHWMHLTRSPRLHQTDSILKVLYSAGAKQEFPGIFRS